MKAGDTSEPDRLDSLGAAALSLAQQHGVCYWRPAAKDNAEEKLSQLQACRQERASERSPWKKAAKMGGRPSCTGPWAEGTGLPCRPTRAGREPQDGGEATGCGFRLRRAGPRPRRSESLQVVASTGQCSEPRTGWQGGQERVQTGVTKISFDRKDIVTFHKPQGKIEKSTVMVGDFNLLLLGIHRSSRQRVSKDVVDLNNSTHQPDLMSIYRTHDPTTAKYSFCSSSHELLTTIITF